MRFVGLALEDRVPDAETIGLFGERLTPGERRRGPVCQARRHPRDVGYLAEGVQS